MKTDGETSSVITRRGGRSAEESFAKYFTEVYLAAALSFSLSVNFLTLFISHRGAKIHSVVIIYYRRIAAVERPFQEGGEQ